MEVVDLTWDRWVWPLWARRRWRAWCGRRVTWQGHSSARFSGASSGWRGIRR